MIWELRAYEDDGFTPIATLKLTPDTELSQLVVQQPHRRRGLATVMVRTMEFLAKELGYTRIFATTEVSNEPSRSLWIKEKFKEYYKYEKKLGTKELGQCSCDCGHLQDERCSCGTH